MNTFQELANSYIKLYELTYCQETEDKEKHNEFIKTYEYTIKFNIPDSNILYLPYLVQASCAYICYVKMCKILNHKDVQSGWLFTKLKN